MLIEGDPHQILEGVLISAYALQVTQAFIYVRGEFALGLERVQQALNEAYDHGARRARTSSARGSPSTSSCTPAPARTSAARRPRSSSRSRASAASRGSSRRSSRPPIGLYGEPTVVNNVETMSNIPWIVTNGGAAFAALGEGRSTGTRLFALAGHVRRPGIYELEMVKTTFRDLIYAPVLGGGITRLQHPQGLHPRRRVRALVRPGPGGPAARAGRGGRGRLHARLRARSW